MKFATTIMGVSLRDFPRVAQAFEENGFESIWVPEHLVFPAEMPPLYPYSQSGYPPVRADTPVYDAWPMLSYLAAVTERIRLGTYVYILPLRHPLQTARSVVTVDRLSGGRVTLGTGVGWLPEEFEYLDVPFSERGRRADAAIRAIRRLWTEDVIEVRDEHFHFGPVRFQPKPLQKPSVPIEVGGAAPSALRRAGALGDGWLEIGSRDVAEFATKLETVRAARREADRRGNFEVTASLGLVGQPRDWPILEEAGATRVMTGPPAGADGRVSADAAVDWARRFADEIIQLGSGG